MSVMRKYDPNKKNLVMTRAQVRDFDSWAINAAGVPGAVLMENAGRSCAELIKHRLKDIAQPKVCIFCGTGNNGGDGYVIARHLFNDGFNVGVVICGNEEKIKGDAKTNLEIIKQMGVKIELLQLKTGIAEIIKHHADRCHMLVDALFGTGLTGQLKPEYIELIRTINACSMPILAVDIPSGMDCDTGQPLPEAIRAEVTVTFVAVKKGFVPENDYTGEVLVASIGIEP